ncbi:MAG: pantoate--beta-alanine ligase [Cyanobacteria bacterium J06588_5]
MTVQLLNTIPELRNYLDALSDGSEAGQRDRTIGLVPTMGALHAAHRSLIDRSRQTDDIVIVSIFVNPLQFSANEDLDQYPRPQAADQALCEAAGVDAIFMPSPQAFYGTARPDLSAVTQVVPPLSMVNTLCGHSRPTHFQGVATVVTKLLNVVRPTHAYFGQKDAQQVAILRRMKQDLNLPGEIVVCPIVREPDGLAMSSRNRYLFGPYRQQATVLNRSIQAAKAAFDRGERSAAVLVQTAKAVFDTEPDVTLDYLSLVHPDTLEPLQVIDSIGLLATAAYVGPAPEVDPTATQARLLDNIVLNTISDGAFD